MATCSCNASRAFYRFPAMARLAELTNEGQVRSIKSEVYEVDDAECELFAFRDRTPSLADDEMRASARRTYGMELMDVIHAAETALRMEFSEDEARDLRDAVERKNRERGYYDGKATA